MPRLFLVSLVRVCTRIRAPRLDRGRRNPFNLRAFCAAQCGETAQCNPLVSIAGQRELGQRAFENCDASKELPVYFKHGNAFSPPFPPSKKRFEQPSTFPFISVIQKQMRQRERFIAFSSRAI